MEFKNENEIRSYLFTIEDDGVNGRRAEITFEKNYTEVEWNFVRCDFSATRKKYSISDWNFLRQIANKIDEIYKELND